MARTEEIGNYDFSGHSSGDDISALTLKTLSGEFTPRRQPPPVSDQDDQSCELSSKKSCKHRAARMTAEFSGTWSVRAARKKPVPVSANQSVALEKPWAFSALTPRSERVRASFQIGDDVVDVLPLRRRPRVKTEAAPQKPRSVPVTELKPWEIILAVVAFIAIYIGVSAFFGYLHHV